MESIAQGAIAGIIAALAATIILGASRYIHQRLKKSEDVKYLRDLLIQGRERVLDAEDTFNRGMCVLMPADVLRAAQYNNMTKQVGIFVERWALHLSHAEKRDIYEALDWYHVQGLPATKVEGKVVFLDLSEGRWPTEDMSREAAKQKFDKLEAIEWLKLKGN